MQPESTVMLDKVVSPIDFLYENSPAPALEIETGEASPTK
jgi:hypothetical protein